jgi:hypothetical protein
MRESGGRPTAWEEVEPEVVAEVVAEVVVEELAEEAPETKRGK